MAVFPPPLTVREVPVLGPVLDTFTPPLRFMVEYPISPMFVLPLPATVKEPDMLVEPVTVKDPVGILTVPYNVWKSSAASPNWFEPVDN